MLKYHVGNVHEGNSKVYECQICETNYSRPPSLKIHQRRTHEGKKFDCIFCKKNYTSKPPLEDHVLKIHGGNLTSDLSN